MGVSEGVRRLLIVRILTCVASEKACLKPVFVMEKFAENSPKNSERKTKSKTSTVEWGEWVGGGLFWWGRVTVTRACPSDENLPPWKGKELIVMEGGALSEEEKDVSRGCQKENNRRPRDESSAEKPPTLGSLSSNTTGD